MAAGQARQALAAQRHRRSGPKANNNGRSAWADGRPQTASAYPQKRSCRASCRRLPVQKAAASAPSSRRSCWPRPIRMRGTAHAPPARTARAHCPHAPPTRTHTRTRARAHALTQTRACARTHTRAHRLVRAHTHAHTRTRTYTRTQAHRHIGRLLGPLGARLRADAPARRAGIVEVCARAYVRVRACACVNVRA